LSLVSASIDGRVGLIELRRPERHNSLVPGLLDDLMAAHREIVDGGAAAGVLAAAGPTFSTGGDIRGIRDAADRLGYAQSLVGRLNDAILALAFGPIPMVAAVHGMVTGGSLGLVLACDSVVVAESAIIRSWYATVGFAPDGGWTALLPDRIGSRRAAGILLRDDTITVDEALAWGLADEVAPADLVRERAVAVAGRIAAGVPGAVGAIRRLCAADQRRIADRLEDERTAFVVQVATPEATAGMDRFLAGELR